VVANACNGPLQKRFTALARLNLLRANCTIAAERLVDAKCFIGKLRRNPKFLAAELQCFNSIVLNDKTYLV